MAQELLDVFDGMDGAELLQDTFLFKNLGFDETTSLLGEIETKEYADGALIIEQGSIGDGLYVIQTGTTAVWKSVNDENHQVATLEAGALFGEMSLIENELTSASVKADGEVQCLYLSRDKLDAIMDNSETLSRKVFQAFCKTLSERLRKTTAELHAK